MNKALVILMISVSFICSSCMEGYLDYKPNKKTVVPNTFNDYRAILDYGNIMNTQRTPHLGEVSADNYWVADAILNSTIIELRSAYLWDDFIPEADGNWNNPFLQIFYTNVVLEGVEKLGKTETENSARLKQLKGEALFFRAWAYFQLSQLFTKPYNEKTVETELGLPIRLESDITINSVRSTLKKTYSQILNDAAQSAELLEEPIVVKTRPTKLAAFALLAKVYLQMSNYEEAFRYSDQVLKRYNTLLDYNTLDAGKTFPFEILNEEVIWHCTMATSSLISPGSFNVDSVLYGLYDDSDLRKKMFYQVNDDGVITYRGSYSESEWEFFAGIAVDELYLIRAECFARNNDIANGLKDLNTLLTKRFEEGSFENLNILNKDELLREIISERRKELAFRGIRWHDLRRLNFDPRFSTVLERNYRGKVYQLMPNDKRYTLPIPLKEIELSGIEQNDR